MKKICILILLSLSLTLTGCSSNSRSSSTTKSTSSITGNSSSEPINLPYASFLSENNPVVTIKVKDFGEMKVELFPDVANNTVNNFINYVQSSSYTNSTFHRVISDFMIQGGIVTSNNKSIKGEFQANGVYNILPHYRGVISMARTSANDSATSQFFIVHKDSSWLDGNYAAFGGLISGFDVLDLIATSETVNDSPLIDIVIESVTLSLNGYVPSSVVYIE